MNKIIFSNEAPAAIGPYAHAVEANNTLYVSGQVPFIPSSGEIIEGGILKQTQQCLDNIQAILNTSGYDKKDVVKATIYLKDMNDFNNVNEVYGNFFAGHTPARVAIEVARLPRDVLIEIDVIACK